MTSSRGPSRLLIGSGEQRRVAEQSRSLKLEDLTEAPRPDSRVLSFSISLMIVSTLNKRAP